jgi:hypothetical protein
MCCFSRPVDLVKGTHIFARSSKAGRQFLVYSMTLAAKEDLAMILPIPVPKNSKEDAVRFVNLEKYQDFFKDMDAGFPKPGNARGPSLGGASGSKEDKKLQLVDVGSYEASFVPAIKDFDRLDERFRLPSGVWEKLPGYKEFGFVVFKLKKGQSNVHPMAFEFPRANPKKLFFPTVHIHDGKVHPTAGFDHALYCQVSGDENLEFKWRESPQPAGLFMKVQQAQGLLDANGHCYLQELKGNLKNEDIYI